MEYDFEQWCELARPFYAVIPKEPVVTAGVKAVAAPIGALLTTKIETPAQVLIHDPQLQRGVCHEYLLFERFYSGGGRGEVGDVGFQAGCERLHLIDMSQRYVSVKNRSRSRGVLVPHAALGFNPSVDPSFFSVDLDSPEGRVLAAAHQALLDSIERATQGDALRMADAFVDLLRRLMLRRELNPDAAPDSDFTLGLLMRNYVKTELPRQDIGAAQLALAFKVSRATVYRHFEDEGGVKRYIRDRRLDRCFFELAGSKPSRGRIKAVAERWKFADASHFNRMFRERFGLSPSECCVSSTLPKTELDGPVIDLTRRWMDDLRTR